MILKLLSEPPRHNFVWREGEIKFSLSCNNLKAYVNIVINTL